MKKKKIILIVILSLITLTLLGILIYRNFDKNEKVVVQSNERDETKEQIEIINEYINIRKENNSEAEILGKVYEKEIYTVLEKTEDEYYNWVLIETSNGIKGYIAIKYEEEEYASFLEIKELEVNEDEK